MKFACVVLFILGLASGVQSGVNPFILVVPYGISPEIPGDPLKQTAAVVAPFSTLFLDALTEAESLVNMDVLPGTT
ncbi:hypothetical protein FF38_08875 [Lucilia cuprina]|uniref:Uncharacterized protein n=1 Tax=Lucilia cuprina TaxID=7375 RepID=A0A0L0BVS0_LUCCU|nr:hypothetical protein CVS40_4736 [Lucilia cuprina]KNC24116.1 hypothetical protein FF38_08875 [Lucilia cuprina]